MKLATPQARYARQRGLLDIDGAAFLAAHREQSREAWRRLQCEKWALRTKAIDRRESQELDALDAAIARRHPPKPRCIGSRAQLQRAVAAMTRRQRAAYLACVRSGMKGIDAVAMALGSISSPGAPS